jgi:GTP diphosphokinase / guanosine-3',5'-bis(diphosphate) 3'-diphosphatase
MENRRNIDKTTFLPYNERMTLIEIPTSGHQLLQTVAAYLPPEAVEEVQKGLLLSAYAHHGYFRKNSIPYVEHPIAVAEILAGWRAPTAVLLTALLHDICKDKYADCPPPADIERLFGSEVTRLLQDIARLGRLGPLYTHPDPESLVESPDSLARRLPWGAWVLQRAPLAVVVKLADRLHNFATLDALAPERRTAFAAVTLNIFVHFAERLGMRAVKRQLEDQAFSVLQPDVYQRFSHRYPLYERQAAAAAFVDQIQERLTAQGIPAQVAIKNVSLYTIYQEEMLQSRTLPPHVAQPIVIVTETTEDCYRALGSLHQLWPPVPGRIRDYIATPKNNGYRALHTSVRLLPNEKLVLLLRDRQMEMVAEKGLTAGWWGVAPEYLPQFTQWREPPKGNISVLTPDGDLKTLPVGATPLDFAYAIHKGLGHQCTKAVVNGRLAPLNRPLENGDVVQIISSQVSIGPLPEWLNIVKTARARSAIRQWLRVQNPTEASKKGWQILDARLRQEGLTLAAAQAAHTLQAVAEQLHYDSRDDLLLAIGLKEREAGTVVEMLRQVALRGDGLPSLQATILSLAESDLPQRFARCCHPLPPDPIVGYVTRKSVVTIHCADCARVAQLRPLITAEWNTLEIQRQTEIAIQAIDRPRLIQDVTAVIAETGLNMTGFHAERMADGSAQIHFTLSEMPQNQLALLLKRLGSVPDVRQVHSTLPRQVPHFFERGIVARQFANPYTLRPVSGESFFGRRAELRTLVNNLREVKPGEAVLLWGPRRIGKTSLLLEFRQSILSGADYVPVFVDMQRLSGRSATMLLFDISRAIVKTLNIPSVKPPNLSRMKRDPLGFFRGFLEKVPALQNKLIVLILDEFQLLGDLTDADGVSVADINRYFRSLLQHQHGLTVVFSGGGVLETLLRQPEASFMLELAQHQKLGCLDEAAARQLIVKPLPRIRYEEGVVNDLLALTAGHPYYLQWLCSELIIEADREERPFIRQTDLRAALTNWMPKQGEQFFNHLWGSSLSYDLEQQQRNKLALTAIAELADGENGRWLTLEQIQQSGITAVLSEKQIWELLHGLAQMDTLESRDDDQFRIKVALCEQWLRTNYNLSWLLKEMENGR